MSAGDIQYRICSAVAMHHISGRQYRFGIRSMPHTIKTCMRCLEEMIDVKDSIDGNKE